jgi:brefeldin A-inhibited guanine nucleotide-exchange protein 3
MEIFLSALDLSYVAALKFDCRPGLKFLVQKVANLEQPANLYRQAAAAWTIKIVTLFELCLYEIEELHATLELVKTILGTGLSERECVYDVKYRKFIKYLRQLRTTFDELCETYVEVVLDEDGRYTKVDSFAERKIFLLVAQPDDYPEITRKEPIDDWLTSTPTLVESSAEQNPHVCQDQSEVDDDDHDDPDDADVYNPNLDDESGLEELGVECENDPRPFRLSDLAADYSTDSGPQSEPETDDSRPVSRLGSVTEKIVYPDRSGGTSSEGYIDVKYNAVTPAPPKMMYSRDDLCYKLESIDAPTKTSRMDTKMLDRHTFSDEAFLYHTRSYLGRRASDPISQCPIARPKSLTSVTVDSEGMNESSPIDPADLRPKSVMELRGMEPDWTTSGEPSRESRDPAETVKEEDKKNSKSSQILDNIDELLRDYERSKRGFRTNPFLRNDEDATVSVESQSAANQEMDFHKRSVTKDSEAHRKAWADTLNTTLEWALALSVSSLSLMLFRRNALILILILNGDCQRKRDIIKEDDLNFQ